MVACMSLIDGKLMMAIEGCMHVVVYSVFFSPFFALAIGFRFTAIPLLDECH